MQLKPPIRPVRWQPPPIVAIPDVPARPVTVVPVGGDGPEDVVVDAAGRLWTGLIDGRIVRLSPDGGDQTVVADTGGRPLGLERQFLHAARLTESTSDFHYEHFLGAVLEGRGSGGLYRLTADGAVETVVPGLYFANGVTVTADGSALVFAESLGRRLSKYWLTGPRAGAVTPLAVHLPGMPDNISTGADGRIWVAMVTEANPAAESLMPQPPWIRRLIWRLPARLRPKVEPEVWVVGLDPDSGDVVGGIRTKHPNFGGVTGVVETGGRVWMSTIEFPALAYFHA